MKNENHRYKKTLYVVCRVFNAFFIFQLFHLQIRRQFQLYLDYYVHRVHEKNCTPVYVAITLANNVGF